MSVVWEAWVWEGMPNEIRLNLQGVARMQHEKLA